MKATATAHPIQGLVKYHGMRDTERRLPYHDSISVCTAPSRTTTTVEWEPDATPADDEYRIDGEVVEGRGAERIELVTDYVREVADLDAAVRVESENSFPSNVGFGSSSSGFAALAMSLVEAAGLEMTRPEISTIARRGSSSAARAVTGAYSVLYAGMNDEDCRSQRLDVGTGPDGFDPEEDLRVVTALVPAYKETEEAHREAEASHMFDARMAHVHEQLQRMRDRLRVGEFSGIFEIAEHDSLSLTATTMTGPAGWVYWQPETIAVFNAVRELRQEEDIPVYFSTDTGASVYVNTPAAYADRVEERIAEVGVETNIWEVGGPARVLGESKALF
ncbi:phosphomevalonate decarboxylase MvaD [Halobaculum limi]|uniref:phosphomevalonate decarboxylase MvaD n=1 Tax=Halobaculum limi TaxID=3031916 RepID=UPI0024070452|nr:phosphomevalonate decarboxylase MvaD [Halobaculum sp. YSMS11]